MDRKKVKNRKNSLNEKEAKKIRKMKNRKSTSKNSKQSKIKRSRETSLKKENIKRKTTNPIIKIKIPIFDDSNSDESITINEYINNKKEELKSGKISLLDYIHKIDIDNEKIFNYLENIINTDINKFFQLL